MVIFVGLSFSNCSFFKLEPLMNFEKLEVEVEIRLMFFTSICIIFLSFTQCVISFKLDIILQKT